MINIDLYLKAEPSRFGSIKIMKYFTIVTLLAIFYPSSHANVIARNLSPCDTSIFQHNGVEGATRRTLLKNGNYIIQGIFPLSSTRDNCNTILQNGLVAMMALTFAIKKLENSSMHFNSSSFGFHMDDSCNSIPSIMAIAIEIVNQYRGESVCRTRSCNGQLKSVEPITAVVGPFQSFTSIPFASLLGLESIPIVSPSASSRLLSKKDLYKSFARIIPSDIVQARVVAEVLRKFKWNYIYVIGSDDNYGKLGISILKDYTEEYNFCIVADDYIPYATNDMERKAMEIVDVIEANGNARVVVIFAYNIQIELIMSEADRRNLKRVWLLSDAFHLTGEGSLNLTDRQISGLFKVAPKSKPVSGFQTFLENEIKTSPHCNIFLKLFMQQEFRCTFNDSMVFCPNHTAEGITKKFLEVDSSLIGNTVDAANAIAVAIDKFHTDKCNYTHGKLHCPNHLRLEPLVLTKYLFNTSFRNVYGEVFEFDKNGDPKYPSYDIGNVQKVDGKFRIVRVGKWDPRTNLDIDMSRVVWPYWTGNITPKSTCSQDCSLGYYISARTECCWSCEKCLPNTISTTSNSRNCTKCRDGFVSNEDRTECIKYSYIALNADDVAGVAIIVINTLGIAFCLFIFVCYRYFRRSTIIKVHTRMAHVLYLSMIQLVVSFAYGEILLMKRSHSYCGIIVGSMYVLRTGFAVLIFSRTRIFLSMLQRFIVPATGMPLHLAHLTVTLVLMVVQFGLTISCGVLDPISISTQPLEIETSLALNCSFDYTVFQAVAYLVYPNLVLLITTVAAIRERSQRQLYSEAKFLNFAAIANCILSVAFFPTYKYVVGIYKTIVLAFTMDVCAFTYIGCLMLPHLYMAYSDKNKVSSPSEDVSRDISLAAMHRAKYRTSLQEIQEEQSVHRGTKAESWFVLSVCC